MTLLHFAVAAVSAGVGGLLWSRRGAPGGPAIAVLFAAVVVWNVGYGGEIAAADLGAKSRWVQVQYVGIVVAPPAGLLFALHYSGRGAWLTWWRLAALAVVPVTTLGLAWSDGLHHLVWSVSAGTPVESGRPLALDHGPAFDADVVFSYVALLVAVWLLFRDRWSLRRLVRRQSIALALAAATPWLCNLLYMTGLRPAGLDLTPIGFAVTATACGIAWRRWGLLEIAPVARHALIEHLRDGMLVIDARGRIVDCNGAIAPLLTCPIEDAIGRDAASALTVAIEGLRSGETVEVVTGHGSRHYELETVELPPTVAATARLLLFRDVTTREELHALLRAQALTDDLTKLPNRRAFHATLRREIAEPERRVGVLFVDLDDFKRVNDTLGHHAGDEILATIGRRLMACVRAEDVVARLGGDEFAVLLPDVDGPEIPMAIADRITSAVQEPIDIDGSRLTMTASVGLHLATAADVTAESVLAAADRRMYLTKQTRHS